MEEMKLMTKTELVLWLVGLWGGFALGWALTPIVPGLSLLMILFTAFGFPLFMTGVVVEEYQNHREIRKRMDEEKLNTPTLENSLQEF